MTPKDAMLPRRKGKVEIFPEILDGSGISVTIVGTPEGLRYLARLLEYVAGQDQDKNRSPVGSREHIHLHAGMQLGEHSCEVEICRADAKGTGDLPSYMASAKTGR